MNIIELTELEHVDEDVLQAALDDSMLTLCFKGKPVCRQLSVQELIVPGLHAKQSWCVKKNRSYVLYKPALLTSDFEACPTIDELVYECDVKSLFAHIHTTGWIEAANNGEFERKTNGSIGSSSERLDLFKILRLL